MPPDLNSLPPSHHQSPSSSPLPHRNVPISSETEAQVQTQTHSHASQSPVLAPSRSSRSSTRTGRLSVSERRRSAVGANFNSNDSGEQPTSEYRSSISHAFRTASPSSIGGSPIIATGDPHHHRTPSLGELHQELEQEQEAQVNRLLHMIRNQQQQLQQLQQQQQQPQQSSHSSTAVADDSTPPPSEPSVPFPPLPPLPTAASRTTSPSLRPFIPLSQSTSIDSSRGSEGLDWIAGTNENLTRRSSRDEIAFYQTEAAMLTRENQILKQRIRDLERQIGELRTSSPQPSVSRSGEVPTPSASEDARSADQSASGDAGRATEKT